MSDVFKALADPTRREILLMLTESSSSINDISEKFEMSRPAISRHVKVLQESNLLTIKTDQTDARQRNCHIQIEALKEITEYIAQLEKFWNKKLDSLDNYIKKQGKNNGN